MNKFTAALSMVLCFILGVMLDNKMQAHINSADPLATAKEVDNAARAALFDRAQQNVALWQARATTCENNFTGSTILYEPGAEPSMRLPVLHGLLSVEANIPTGSAPRWVIPAKIQPRMVGAGSLQYAWIDGKTLQANGPYNAMPLQAGERFNVTGWVSQ
jgi:hypothetical protein